MPEDALPASRLKSKLGSAWITVVVAGLLALYLVVALSSTLTKGPSYDEEQQLAVGYNIWTHHGFRMENADGDLIKRWAALPFLLSRPHTVPDDSSYLRNAKPYRFGYEFFFQSGNQPEWLLLQGRCMNALLGALTGFLVFYCSRQLFGTLGGIFSLILFVLNPNMLVFGGIVSTEMSICLTLLGAVWSVWRLLHRVTWKRLGLGLLFTSLLVLAKPSALVIFPITFILVLIKLFFRRPLEWQLFRPRLIRRPLAQLGLFAVLFLLHALVAWMALWAHYEFRYSASPDPSDTSLILTQYRVSDPVDPTVAATMDWLGAKHLLPEGFLHGIHTLLASNERREGFMDGQWIIGGWRTFFVHAFWDKTSPLLLIMLVAGLVGWGVLRLLHKTTAKPDSFRVSPPSLYEGIPYLVLIVIYFFVASIQDVNIGHRHILPIYPPIFILAGGSMALLWFQMKYVSKAAITVILIGVAVDTALLFPDYLAYFSPFVGGPANGYKHLVDSSIDWGMDLPTVKKWLDQHNPGGRDPVFLAYFGTDNPEYHGINSHRLPSNPDWRPYDAYPYSPGIFIISATLFESDYTATFGPWNTEYEQHYQTTLHDIIAYEHARNDPAQLAQLLKIRSQEAWDGEYGWFEKLRFGRLTAWLRHHRPKPDANAGYSILIWRLSQRELEDALLGPPAEIDDTPLLISSPPQ